MVPAGAVGLGVVGGAGVGLVVVGAGEGGVVGGVNLGVGKEGSVGPAPGVAIGLPSMILLQPATRTASASRATNSGDPPGRLLVFCDNRTRNSRKMRYQELRLRTRWRKLLQ